MNNQSDIDKLTEIEKEWEKGSFDFDNLDWLISQLKECREENAELWKYLSDFHLTASILLGRKKLQAIKQTEVT